MLSALIAFVFLLRVPAWICRHAHSVSLDNHDFRSKPQLLSKILKALETLPIIDSLLFLDERARLIVSPFVTIEP